MLDEPGKILQSSVCKSKAYFRPSKFLKALYSADLPLFARKPIPSRRGSAIAGIACGLPLIAYTGAETATPITDADVILVDAEKTTDWRGVASSIVRR